MSPEQEKKLREMSLEELNELTNAQRLHAKEWGEVIGKQNAESGHLQYIASLGGNASPWTKDSKNQSYAGKIRAEKGGIETLLENSSYETRSKGGKKSGKQHVESGHWKKVQQEALKVVTQRVQCTHCPKVGPRNVMQAWHFDKCKWKGFDFNQVHEMSKNGMSNNKIAQELGITRFNVSDILNGKF